MDEQLALIRAHTVEIIPEDELRGKLASGRPLRVKLGVDASGPDIHLGHAVVLRKLRVFQDLGHRAVMIVGDFTGMIGDPSGRSETRRQLTREQVERNIETYQEQVFKILDPSKTEFRYNSEWLSDLTPEQIMRLTATHTVAQLLARDDFAKRYAAQHPIGLHELLYPIFQGYDSIAVRADIEIGGTDQTFNFLVARELQRTNPLGETQEAQCIITFPLLVGTDGVEKMGKSLDNYIGISEAPDQIYGKVMSIPDEVMEQYFELCTDVPAEDIAHLMHDMGSGAVNPRDVKRRLAREIVSLYHSVAEADRADGTFMRVFSAESGTEDALREKARRVTLPAELSDVDADWGTALQSLGLVHSKTEGRKFILARAVRLDGVQVVDPWVPVKLRPGMLISIGKRRAVVLE